ncbi:X-linked interleukin-1 receptor accessory protein-like 2 [Styela clava]
MLLKNLLALMIVATACEAVSVIDTEVGKTFSTGAEVYNCTELGQKNITAYIGWPFHFSCLDLTKNFYSAVFPEYVSKYQHENITCSVYDDNAISLWNETATAKAMKTKSGVVYNSFDVTGGQVSNYRLVLRAPSANYCAYEDILFHPKDSSENYSCQNLSQEIGTIKKKLKIGNVYRMTCQLDYLREPALYIQNVSKAEYIWTHNCSENLPENTVIVGNKLTLTNVDFLTGGIYSCKIRYKGNERYATRHEVCIQHGNAGTYSMKCPDKVKVKLGDDVNITCSVDFGTGQHLWFLPTAIWSKKLLNGTSEGYCTKLTLLGGPRNSTVEERANCDNAQITDLYKRCFLYEPSADIKEALQHLTRLTLIIKEMKESDAGIYGIKFSVDSDKSANSTIELEIDQDAELLSYAHIIGLGIMGLVLLLLLIGLCVWRKIDILWFAKKYFGPYEKEVKRYTAYLAYHYSTENMTDISRKLTNDLVGALYKVLDELNATTYDDHKDENEVQMQIENIANAQKDCHRIIIILNPEYVTDHWSLHKAYAALRNMIEGGTQVIFISLPGVEKYFEQLPSEPKTALKHAMKMNTTIKWQGSVPLNGSIRRHLEYALPKCKQQDRRRGEAAEKLALEERVV